MINEFVKGTKIFRVKTQFDQEYLEEVPVHFDHMNDAKLYLNDAMRNRHANKAIQRIAKNVAPKYGRYSRRPSPGEQELLDQLCFRIYSGDLSLVEVDYGLRSKPRQTINFPEISNFKLSECCYETMIVIRQKIKLGKALNLVFPGILFVKFFSHPQAPIKTAILSNMYTITTTDWEQLAIAMAGLNRIQKRGIYGDTKMEIANHLLRSDMKHVAYWQTVQKCIVAA